MEQSAYKLPIRLLPRKGSQLFRIAFFTFFTGFAVFWIAMAASFTWFADQQPAHEFGLFDLFPLFGLLFVGVGLAGLVHAVAKLLPGSPYHHLQVSHEGVVIRTLRRRQSFAWDQLSSFDVSVRERRDSDGDRHYDHYVVAMPAANSASVTDERERYNRAVLRINADEFGADDGAVDAADMAAWFNLLREKAVDRRLSAHEEVAVPPGFRDSVWAASGRPSGSPPARPGRPASVIQR